MDGTSVKKSTSLETLVIQNISNTNDLKSKLKEIINSGLDYEYDVSACLKTLLKNSDPEIVLLSTQAVSEIAKSGVKREIYAQKEIIEAILKTIQEEFDSGKTELLKQCCRALGNLCCDCDTSRKIILDINGVSDFIKLIEYSLIKNEEAYNTLKMLACKSLLNYSIGGQEFSDSIVRKGVIELIHRILSLELQKDDICDDIVSTVILILSVIIDNSPGIVFEEKINKAVLDILRVTSNVDVSELCLEHLYVQAEHDSVKTLLAKEGALQLVCHRLDELVAKRESGDLNAEDAEVDAVVKQACDLIIIVLTGDEAMQMLYKDGVGEIYLTMIRCLDSSDYQILATAILAIGNFARRDDYCKQLMENNVFDKLLDIFEVYNGFSLRMQQDPTADHPIGTATLTKILHAVLSALRNLAVPVENKRIAAAANRAPPLLLAALPHTQEHQVAYKLLATIRMLVDGQESVARQLLSNREALKGVARWGAGGECAGAGGEAPRLLAWAARLLPRAEHSHALLQVHTHALLQVDGCVASLVNMLVVCHSVMQNEAILALTLLALESINTKHIDTKGFDSEGSLVSQLLSSEIGKHISVLIDTNCAKMPMEVAENLLAFLDITCKNNKMAAEYKRAKLQESLKKFNESRNDFSDDLKNCIDGVLKIISQVNTE